MTKEKLANLTTLNLGWARIYADAIHRDLQSISRSMRAVKRPTTTRIIYSSQSLRRQMKCAARELSELRKLLEI
jgi:hypothetical protein